MKNFERLTPGIGVSLTVRFYVLALVTLAASSALAQRQASWKPQWNQTVSAAKKEGKVVVFGPAGELIRNALVESFSNSFPDIVFEYAGGRAAEQAIRIKAERDGGVFSVDVFIGGSVTMMELGSVGALERIESALILPEVKDPKYWRDGRLEFTNPSTRNTLVFSQPNAPVLVDPKQVKLNDEPRVEGKSGAQRSSPGAGPAGSLFRWLWTLSVLMLDYIAEANQEKAAVLGVFLVFLIFGLLLTGRLLGFRRPSLR